MSSVFKISEAASLALHSMVILARNQDRLVTTEEMAETLQASQAHLNKVFQLLARAALVKSTRGRKGGHALAGDAQGISLLEVYEAVEGRLVPPRCLLAKPICDGHCIFGGMLQDVNSRVRDHLAKTLLSEFAQVGMDDG